MARRLVFVHGRDQQRRDALALKKQWIESWQIGLEAAGLSLPLAESDIRFPYYGDTLEQLAGGADPADAAAVVIRGNGLGSDEKAFANAIARHIQDKFLTAGQLAAVAGQDVVDRGPLQWEWFQGVMQALDRYVPGASAAGIVLRTHDVYQYLKDETVRDTIDEGVMQAFEPGVETVVVAHSLGSVVAYRLLRHFGQARGWRVPMFITLGSPLGVEEIRSTLKRWAPTRCPACVDAWFNAFDERDVVALYALDPGHFPIDPAVPAIENKRDVCNGTDNRHSISGYLDDPVVAGRIHAALV